MEKFLVIYNSPAEAMQKISGATTEQKADGMKAWMDWKDSMGDKMIDFGTMLMPGQRLLAGDKSEVSSYRITGYSIIQATNMTEAKSLLNNHPHLSWSDGCSIDVHEYMDMKG